MANWVMLILKKTQKEIENFQREKREDKESDLVQVQLGVFRRFSFANLF